MDGMIVNFLPKMCEQSLRYDTPRNPKIIKLSEQQNHKCCYCGCRTFLNEDDRNGLSNLSLATIDHVKAKINGGQNTLTNTVMCCQK
jgi:5-methylcytosine-specific restriction endonuclease McrA